MFEYTNMFAFSNFYLFALEFQVVLADKHQQEILTSLL